MRRFSFIWFGQFISLIGSGMTGFGLGVWVYQQTGSVTRFSLISLSAIVPMILVSPLAGALTDRWNRRRVLILSDTGAALSTLVIAALLYYGTLDIWHICLLSAVSSAFRAFQWPAFIAATTLLVPEKHLGRASGMTQAGRALSRLIVSPLLAGALMEIIGLTGIILIDFASFLFALITLMTVRIPDTGMTDAGKAGKSSLWREIIYGWTYITERTGLLGLLLFFSAGNFLLGLAGVLFIPLMLSFSSAKVLGTVSSIGGAGMLAGGLVMGIWGGPSRLIYGVFGFSGIVGLCILSAGSHTNISLFGIAIFFYFFSMPLINGCIHVIFQKNVESDLQGRVFATTGAIANASRPLAYLVAGPLSDHIFEPLMAPDGLLSQSIGQVIGTGPGRGIGLMFIIIGGLILLLTVMAYAYPPLRRVEDKLGN